MKKIDPVFLLAVSDLLINLSAGWFATVLILPNLAEIHSLSNWFILTGNILAGIVSLYLGYKLRKLQRREKYD